MVMAHRAHREPWDDLSQGEPPACQAEERAEQHGGAAVPKFSADTEARCAWWRCFPGGAVSIPPQALGV